MFDPSLFCHEYITVSTLSITSGIPSIWFRDISSPGSPMIATVLLYEIPVHNRSYFALLTTFCSRTPEPPYRYDGEGAYEGEGAYDGEGEEGELPVELKNQMKRTSSRMPTMTATASPNACAFCFCWAAVTR